MELSIYESQSSSDGYLANKGSWNDNQSTFTISSVQSSWSETYQAFCNIYYQSYTS